MTIPHWLRRLGEGIVRAPLLSLSWLIFATCVTILHAILVVRELVELKTAALIFVSILFLVLLVRELLHERSDVRLRDFMYKLFQATEERTCRYTEEIHHTYVVERDGRDHTIRRWTISPQDHALVWRKVRFGVRGQSPGRHSLDELHAICSAKEGEVWCIPVHEEDPRHLEAVLFFVPPIPQGSIREVSVHHDWPGTWNPLRETGRDTGDLIVAHDDAQSVILEFVFPRGYKNSQFTSRNPALGTVAVFETPQKQSGLRWTIPSPARGQLTYAIEVERGR